MSARPGSGGYVPPRIGAESGGYVPPRLGAPPEAKRDLAAAAMDLLQSNPDAVVPNGLLAMEAPSARRRDGHSAAQKMKEKYAEIAGLQSESGVCDLLGLDGNGAVDGDHSVPSPAPSACSGQLKPQREQARANSAHSLTSEVSTTSTAPPDLQARLELLQPSPQVSSSPPAEASFHAFPGQIVLARYGPTGAFYRARVLHSYSSGGRELADVVWLRPDASQVGHQQFLSSDGLDEAANRTGLEVGVTVHRLDVTAVQDASTANPPESAGVACAQPTQVQDLLDLT